MLQAKTVANFGSKDKYGDVGGSELFYNKRCEVRGGAGDPKCGLLHKRVRV